jgi:hypothetical protein
MADQFLVDSPYSPFTIPNQFKSISNGKVYIGIVDQDPVNPTQRIPVYVVNESGLNVLVTQPLSLNAGGYLVYNGQVSKFITEQPYSMVVLDKLGAELWRVDDVSKVDPEYLAHNSLKGLNDVEGHDAIYSRNFKTVADLKAGIDATGQTIDMSLLVGFKVFWRGYYSESDGGSNWGIVKSGAHSDDGGSIFSLGVSLYVEANLKGKKTNLLKFGGKLGVDNTTSIQSAINAVNHLHISGGIYRYDSQLTLKSNFKITADKGSGFDYTNSIAADGIIGTSLAGIEIGSLTMTGSGVAFGFSNIKLTTCSDVDIEKCDISKAGAHSLYLIGCTNVKTTGNKLHNNYFYGIEDKEGVSNKHSHNSCTENGITGVATSTGGRGINVWKGTDINVNNNTIKGNTEYGFRHYSEIADLSATTGCSFHHNYLEDNVGCDILMYDESLTGSLIFRNLSDSNIVKRTTIPTLGASVVIQGKLNRVNNTHVSHEGAIGNYAAFNMFHADGSSIKNSSAENVNVPLSFSETSDFIVDGFDGAACATAATGLLKSGVVIINSQFTHGGAGVSDIALDNISATGKNYFDAIKLTGFHTGIRTNTEAVSISGVETIASTFAGLRALSNDMSLKEFHSNTFDSATAGELLQMEKKTSQYGGAKTRFPSAPVSLNWVVGDEVVNSAPAVGQPKSWVCTTAGSGSGAGGTAVFTSTGNL